jgi:hypothetical protein
VSNAPRSEFEKAAAENPRSNIISEFWHFLAGNKKWWLLPLIAFALISGAILVLSTTAAAPFIYAIF